MTTRKSPIEPKAWNFDADGILVQIIKEDGTYQVGSQVTPRRKTCATYDEAVEEVPVIGELTKKLIDANQAVEGWMDPPSEEPPPPAPNRAARRAK